MALEIRKKFLTIYFWSIALYGSEISTISTARKIKLEAFEIWCYRKMSKIKWIEKITNEAVLDRIKEKRVLNYTIKVL
jgi:hypothetical protein